MSDTNQCIPRGLGAAEVRLMQGLAQEVTILRPELLEGGATVGELAWIFGKDRVVLGHTWRRRLWYRTDGSGQLDAWAWVHLPHRVTRSDGSMATSHSADLVWKVHPDHPDLLDEILTWYAKEAPGLGRTIMPQDAYTDTCWHACLPTATRPIRRQVATTGIGTS